MLQRLAPALREAKHPAAVFLATRVPLFLFAYAGLAIFPMDRSPDKWRAFADNLFLDGWARWDSGWYQTIAEQGYDGSTIAFFPLYPMLVRIFAPLFFGNAYLSGIFVANACFLLALILLDRLTRRYLDAVTARRVLWLTALFPFSFFFDAMYTESVFLVLAVAAFYLAERGRWWHAGAAAAAVGAVRPNGFLILAGLGLLGWEQARLRLREVRWSRLAPALALGLVGPLGYLLFLTLRMGGPSAWLAAQSLWESHGGLRPLVDLLSSMATGIAVPSFSMVAWLQLLAWLSGLGLALGGLRAWLRRAPGSLPLAYWAWALLNLLLAFSRWHSAGRFTAVMFPCFVQLAVVLRRETAYLAVLAGSALFLGLLTLVFTHWYWIL
jgi:hypothetical protein